jgi:hypothetical protein
LEVHPPEHGIHSWRDFFVHMGTICLGLLIAIGMEQSVEWMHRRHERAELREAIQRDLERTVSDSEVTYQTVQRRGEEIQTLVMEAQACLQNHTTMMAAMPPSGGGAIDPISDPSFRAAQASGLLTLLAQDDVRAFADMDSEAVVMERLFGEFQTASSRVNSFKVRFGTAGTPESRWAQADASDLRAYMEALALLQGTLRTMAYTNREAHGLALALLRGERDLKKLEQAEAEPMPKPTEEQGLK